MEKRTQKQRILDLMAPRQWVHFRDLNDICFRYGARLYDLRKEGYEFEERRDDKGIWWYRLSATPPVSSVSPQPTPGGMNETAFSPESSNQQLTFGDIYNDTL
jgi:hypothetical protein